MSVLRATVILLAAASQLACDGTNNGSESMEFASPEAAVTVSRPDPALIRAGADLFQQNCANCHGAEAEGARDWRKLGTDGKYPPPPLDGTGHAWHHPTEILMEVIMDGSLGDGNMPAWRGKLTDKEARAIIAWFQSLWSDDVYAVWSDLDRRYREETL